MGYTKVVTWSNRINTIGGINFSEDSFCNKYFSLPAKTLDDEILQDAPLPWRLHPSNHSLPRTTQRRVTTYPRSSSNPKPRDRQIRFGWWSKLSPMARVARFDGDAGEERLLRRNRDESQRIESYSHCLSRFRPPSIHSREVTPIDSKTEAFDLILCGFICFSWMSLLSGSFVALCFLIEWRIQSAHKVLDEM